MGEVVTTRSLVRWWGRHEVGDAIAGLQRSWRHYEGQQMLSMSSKERVKQSVGRSRSCRGACDQDLISSSRSRPGLERGLQAGAIMVEGEASEGWVR